jgi:sulfonate transport system permease protein
MGIDEGPKFLLIAISTSVPVYVGVYGAIRNMDPRLLDMARTLELPRSTLIRHVVLPGTAPEFLVGLRLSFASAWLSLIFAEQVNAKQGLAKLMSDGRNDFQIDVMLFVVVVYAILGLASYAFVRMLERRLLVWKR